MQRQQQPRPATCRCRVCLSRQYRNKQVHDPWRACGWFGGDPRRYLYTTKKHPTVVVLLSAPGLSERLTGQNHSKKKVPLIYFFFVWCAGTTTTSSSIMKGKKNSPVFILVSCLEVHCFESITFFFSFFYLHLNADFQHVEDTFYYFYFFSFLFQLPSPVDFFNSTERHGSSIISFKSFYPPYKKKQ